MKAVEALRQAQASAYGGGLEDPLEVELLLCHALGWKRARLLASLRESLAQEAVARFDALLERRLRHEPTAYIVGRKEFYGLELTVTSAALIPRPETELVVEGALRLVSWRPSAPLRLAEVGTGCGAIALALARHLPAATIVATDISAEALALAQSNARCLGPDVSGVQWVRTDLLTGLDGPFDLIVANLPYVRSDEWSDLAPEIQLYEPRQALDGGEDGLACIRRLLYQVPSRLAPAAAVILEIGWNQGEAVRALAVAALPAARVEIVRDLAGLERVAIVETPNGRYERTGAASEPARSAPR